MALPSQKADRLMLAALLVAAVVVALVATLIMPPERTGGLMEQPSSFFNAAYGTKAAYLALQKMGYRVAQLRRPIDEDTLRGLDALVLLRPIVDLTEYEETVLLRWVRGGSGLLLAPSTEQEPEHARLRERPSARRKPWFRLGGQRTKPNEPRETLSTRFDVGRRDPLLDGIDSLSALRGQRFETDTFVAGPLADSQAEAVWTDGEGIVAARVRLGQGVVIALSDVHALTNQGLRESDSPLWLANVTREVTQARPDAALAFDEYHGGFPYREASWVAIGRLMLTEGWGASVAQWLTVAALALYARGARFGRPGDALIRRRRQYGEFTRAAGRLLHDAGATDVVRETLLRHFAARARHAVHVPDGIDAAGFARALQNAGKPELASLIASGDATWGTKRLSRRELLDWCRRVQAELEALEHGA